MMVARDDSVRLAYTKTIGLNDANVQVAGTDKSLKEIVFYDFSVKLNEVLVTESQFASEVAPTNSGIGAADLGRQIVDVRVVIWRAHRPAFEVYAGWTKWCRSGFYFEAVSQHAREQSRGRAQCLLFCSLICSQRSHTLRHAHPI